MNHTNSTIVNNTMSDITSNTITNTQGNNTKDVVFTRRGETTVSSPYTESNQPNSQSSRITTQQHRMDNSAQTRNASDYNMTTDSTRIVMTTTPSVTVSEWTDNSTMNTSSTITDISSTMCYSKTTLIIISSVSGGLVLLLTVMSLLCCLRLRCKWRKKLTIERERTDIWSMRTFNNTIINDNFMDYQLASPATIPPRSSAKYWRKSSAYSERSFNIVDPLSRRSSKNHPEDDVYPRSGSLGKRGSRDNQFCFDDSTLRRNTYSAPGGLDEPEVTSSALQYSDKQSSNSRDRSLTFSVGKKQKIDRHVLLTHEEIVEDEKINKYAGVRPRNSMYVTEL
ncbi:hypothetical protein ACF0H5_019958 [Mactra antiquata]